MENNKCSLKLKYHNNNSKKSIHQLSNQLKFKTNDKASKEY